jgi:NTP pyrophosphatase (non-canonical NTP hydrolase)
MLIAAYADFVVRSDLSRERPDARFDIALYGLVGEIGSLGSAIKKRLLADGRRNWSAPNDEIVEELGDSLWYCFAVAAACGLGDAFVTADVRTLQAEVGGSGERAERIRDVLGGRAAEFLTAAPAFLAAADRGEATLDDYRRLAFLTSRTKDDELVEVCLAVLQQLTAELLRSRLPPIERELNTSLRDRPAEAVLSEAIWHIAALASLYGLELGNVAERNVAKLERRFGRSEPTSLPDWASPSSEQFPRRFDVSFVTVGPGRSRMYMDGARLGDDLTDNAYREDGYRFHDVMHLAFIAKLGWSPVFRKLMGRKRRSDRALDEVEDGARAMIVEEAVINAIHAEGVRVAALRATDATGPAKPLFHDRGDISFAFLKRLGSLVAGLEVERSSYWEWEDAILGGFAIFSRLRVERRGTVTVDMDARSIGFSDLVFADVAGAVATIGSARVTAAEAEGATMSVREVALAGERGAAAVLVRRLAIVRALGLEADAAFEVEVTGWRNDLVDARAAGRAQAEMWRRGVVTFRTTCAEAAGAVEAIAFAISDP